MEAHRFVNQSRGKSKESRVVIAQRFVGSKGGNLNTVDAHRDLYECKAPGNLEIVYSLLLMSFRKWVKFRWPFAQVSEIYVCACASE